MEEQVQQNLMVTINNTMARVSKDHALRSPSKALDSSLLEGVCFLNVFVCFFGVCVFPGCARLFVVKDRKLLSTSSPPNASAATTTTIIHHHST